MKKRKYTRKKKAGALFLFILFMGIAVSGGLGLYYINNFSNFLFSKTELLQTTKFEDTETLERKILNDAQSIFEYTALSQVFGWSDEENQKTPLYRVNINNTEYDICLKDLSGIYEILWEAQNGVYEEELQQSQLYDGAEEEILEPYDSVQVEVVEEPAAGSTEEAGKKHRENAYLEPFKELAVGTYYSELRWDSMSAAEKEWVIKEYQWDKVVSAEWPKRFTLNNTAEILIYPGQICRVTYDYLQQKAVREDAELPRLCERGQSYLDTYYTLSNRLDEAETNLRYVIYEESSGLYSSNSESITAGDINKLEKYVSYDNNTHRITTNFQKASVENWNLEYLATSLIGVDSGASFSVGLDTRYPVEDEYRWMSESFSQCRPILWLSLLAIIVGGLGGIFTFVYLIASVGHREDYDEIWLDKFDRWPTEPAALLIVGGILGFVYVCGILAKIFARNFFTSNMIYTVMQILSFVVSAIIGLMGFFSLVKRLKAGTLWKNSILRKILIKTGHGFRQLVKGWPATGKVAGVIVLYWIVTIPLCMFITINRFWGSFFLYVTGIIAFVAAQLTAAGIILWAVLGRKRILDGVERISGGDLDYVINDQGLLADDRRLADAINNIGAGLQDAVDTAVRSERMKADLITNVSHDIKTPLTSIINYVDLMKRENIEDETLKRYLEILDQKSQRLKNLTEDLVEASRASSGNISLQLERINFVELVKQACGEFSEKFEERGLIPVTSFPDYSLHVIADGRRVWRILENLFQNTKKYAMPGTRVYISVGEYDGYATFTMKNISESELNITPEELTERFTRGDASRTTEGSGLGLSIAKSLTELQDGIFEIYLNGDLFQVTVQFEVAEDEPEDTGANTGAVIEDGSGADTGPETEALEDGEPEGTGEKESDGRDVETDDDLEFFDMDESEADREEKFLQEAIEELLSSGLLKKKPQ
ncbi:sensor histidine kinase [Fusibacillus kribbianus]|uniref:histidine kinase n=1 Tax=Fusibacillus kribbianus TaxID=3044208 RepID=A0AAP4B9I8_9FIRM|nr:MFS domain-containing histidine kinase [Ruminococcus sp. YH-rum2234]MDI9242219.1 histidine kinase dimerization/phospho-acceptor domain-containing protein [Ruminococcus sp. YH-rum2234]